MGSNLFVLEEDPDELKDAKGAVLPLELRKRLTEIGWTDDDKPVDQHRERVRTPMSLLPSLHLDLLDNGSSFQSPSSSPSLSMTSPILSSPSYDADLSRPASSASHASAPVKRRSIFVPPLAEALVDLAMLVCDQDHSVSSAARKAIIGFMRDEPALLSRPVLDNLSGRQE